MQLRHENVRIVAGISDHCDALYVALYVCSIRAKQELCRLITPEQERMADGPIPI